MKKNILILALSTLVTACYPVQNPQKANPVKTNTVHIANNSYFPLKIIVTRGQKVTWINEDSAPHSVVGDNFSSELIYTSQTYTHQFKYPGEYWYHCGHHFWRMRGIIKVL